jgi:hypothetical protein
MKDNAAVPDDPRSMVYAIFYWLGIGTLLPWNFFISVPGYWQEKWKTIEVANSTVNATLGNNEMQTNWGVHLAAASMVPNVTMLLLNAAFGHHFK